jgi:hypothetical protein
MALSDFDELRRQLLSDPDFTPTRSQLVDLRFAQADKFSLDELRALSSTTISDPSIKRAIIASADLEFGVARMFEAISEPQDLKVHVFRSPEEACEWLGVPVEALEI